MTEAEARDRVRTLVDATGYRRLERLTELVSAENERQNLVARSTIPTIWRRHVLDSVQLIALARDAEDPWLDIGSGGGFPGLAVAAARPDRPVTLVEPRRLRADFLRRTADDLELLRVSVVQGRIETVARPASVISARAVASLEKLLQAGRRCATPRTTWLLPRGASQGADIPSYRGMTFHVEQSLTDPAASIVVGTGSPA